MHPIAQRAVETDDSITALTEAFFGPDGPIAERGWEVRPSQREMALLVARVIDEGSKSPAWSGVEAPCGTGKGLAYLVPGVLAAIREKTRFRAKPEKDRKENEYFPKLIVSTAGIPLQRQLAKHDVPALAEMLGVPIRAMVVKGRNNYACLQKIGKSVDEYGVDRIVDWLAEGGSGDREDLPWDPGAAWANASVSSDQCADRACMHFAYRNRRMGEDGEPVPLCYWRQAVQGWKNAEVLILNHHYLSLAASLKGVVLAVDEAHELEDAVRGTHTERLHEGSAQHVVRQVQRWFEPGEAEARIQEPVQRLFRAIEYALTHRTSGKVGDVLTLPAGWLGEERVRVLDDSLREVVQQLYAIAVDLGAFDLGENLVPGTAADDLAEQECADAVRAWRSAKSLYQRVIAAATGKGMPMPEGPWAVYAERQRLGDGHRDVVLMSPGDVSPIIANLREDYPCAILTSATMPLDKPAELALGLPSSGQEDDLGRWHGIRRLPSPYPLHTMGLLVVPDRAPDPKGDLWPDWAVDRVVQAVEASGGGALVLSSTYRMMERYARALREELPHIPVRRQGEAGREQLRRWFQEDTDGVLVATRSFFTGVDVQGEACRMVLIDRIPFGRPDDPVEQVVQRHLVQRAMARGDRGANGFILRTLPSAAMVLAQGAGRLIRCATDKGVVVILDRRVMSPKGSWRMLRSALPAFPSTGDMQRISMLLEQRQEAS